MRGGVPSDPSDNIDMTMDDYFNFILWFGCPAGSQVDARSTIAVDFFQELRNKAKRSDGTVLLPQDMLTSEVGRNGEMVPKICHQLQLRHSDWDP